MCSLDSYYPVRDDNNVAKVLELIQFVFFFPSWVMAFPHLILLSFLYLLRMDLLLNSQVLREKIKEGKLKERKVQCKVFWQKEIFLLAFQPFHNLTQYSLGLSNPDHPLLLFFDILSCLRV